MNIATLTLASCITAATPVATLSDDIVAAYAAVKGELIYSSTVTEHELHYILNDGAHYFTTDDKLYKVTD